MFEKKTYIYSESMGVCYVEDITRLVTARKNEVMYYVLRPVFRKEKTAYIPVENHSVELRDLMGPMQAINEAQGDPELFRLSCELGLAGDENIHVEDGDGVKEEAENISVTESLRIEKEEEEKRLSLQYKMADTLPIEEREKLYHRGEVEFVLRQYKREQIDQMHKNEKKKKRGAKEK